MTVGGIECRINDCRLGTGRIAVRQQKNGGKRRGKTCDGTNIFHIQCLLHIRFQNIYLITLAEFGRASKEIRSKREHSNRHAGFNPVRMDLRG